MSGWVVLQEMVEEKKGKGWTDRSRDMKTAFFVFVVFFFFGYMIMMF